MIDFTQVQGVTVGVFLGINAAFILRYITNTIRNYLVFSFISFKEKRNKNKSEDQKITQ